MSGTFATDAPGLARAAAAGRSAMRWPPRAARPAAAAIAAAGLFAAALLAAPPAAAEPLIGGSVSHRSSAVYAPAGAAAWDRLADDLSMGSATTLELDLDARGDRFRAAASFEAALLGGAQASAAWAAAALALASPSSAPELLLAPRPSSAADALSAPPVLLAARLRALYLKLDLGALALTAGRQVVNYGRGALWSPVDIFADLDLSGVSPVRRGIDAVRAMVPLGATGAFDLVAAPAEKPAEGRYAARISGMALGADFGAVASHDGRSSSWKIGCDLKLDLVLGFYAEALIDIPDESGFASMRAAAGADWSWGDLVLAAEYYYHEGGGSNDPLFPGQDHFYLAASYSVTDFFRLSAMGYWGPVAGADRASLSAYLDAAQGASLGAYAAARRYSGEWMAEAGISLEVKF
jgi:hypothetical protein